jgi:hypothetical protein
MFVLNTGAVSFGGLLRSELKSNFLSGFASDVNEEKLGRDQYYADYNANPFAFSVGYEHFLYMNKKPKKLEGYECHGV